jgi:Flp pilus assembly protein CpaB
MGFGIGGSSHQSRWSAVTTRFALRRRLVAAALAGVAVVSTVSALRPPPAPAATVWVAARDLTGGAPVAAADIRAERLPTADVPDGAAQTRAAVVGRLLAAPMRRGEPFTDVRLLSASLLSAATLPGDVAVPVRVTDGPAALALVRAGDTVDVIAVSDSADGSPATSTTVVHDVRVLAIPARSTPSGDGSDAAGGLLIVAANSHQAAALARASTTAQLSVAVQPPS